MSSGHRGAAGDEDDDDRSEGAGTEGAEVGTGSLPLARRVTGPVRTEAGGEVEALVGTGAMACCGVGSPGLGLSRPCTRFCLMTKWFRETQV